MTKTEPRSAGSGGGRDKTQPTPTELLALASALEGSQQQCDKDGTMIAVSRQAVHESLKALRECAITLSAREDSKVKIPRRRAYPKPDENGQDTGPCCAHAYADGWNDCIDKMKPLPKAPTVGEGNTP